MNKTSQRSRIANALSMMSPEAKSQASDKVCERLMTISTVAFADSIFAYLPLNDEVNLKPLLSAWIDASRVISVPLVSWENKTMQAGLLSSLDSAMLRETRHGILEPLQKHPIPIDCIDVILVPGVGFDASGGRLGRGGGFYDQYLSTSRPPIVIGIAFDEQILDRVPLEPHDQIMTVVVTPTRILLN